MGKRAADSEFEEVSLRTVPELERQIESVVECIGDNDSFLIAAHEEPDGDAIGSTLALGVMLQGLGKEVLMFNQDPVPYNCEFLAGAGAVASQVPPDADFDVLVLLDCSELERLGESFPASSEGDADTVVVIDHHKTIDEQTADLYLCDSEAAATAELLYRLVAPIGAELTRDLAECLYCGLMTDTGSFQYSNTSRTTFRIAGELLEAGVEPWEMTMRILESEPLRRIELLGEVLDTLTLSSCGRLAFIEIDREILGETERAAELTDGFINYGRSIRGVEVSTQLREREDGGWKVSFRSKGAVDVSRLASRFGGGGHHNAAGCVMEGPPAEIRSSLTRELTDILDDEETS